MEIEQVAELARTVAALPQAERDFFEGMVAEVQAAARCEERISKLRAMSDEEAVKAALMNMADSIRWREGHFPRFMQDLTDAGFVRGDLKLLREAREALEEVIGIIVEAKPKVPSGDYVELNRLIILAASALSEVEAGRA